CCRAARPIPLHHRAFGNAVYRQPRATGRACPSATSPRSAGYQASDRYYAGDHPPSFFLVRSGTTWAGVVSIIGIACWRASVSAGVVVTGFAAAVPPAAWLTLPTIACPPSLTDTCCTVTFCSPPVR